MSRTKVEYVLTVPAVWSDKARQMTMEAAMRAGLGLGGEAVADEGEGMGLLKLITEPEGAAEYALRSIQPNSMKVCLYLIFLCLSWKRRVLSGLGLDLGGGVLRFAALQFGSMGEGIIWWAD